MIYVIERIRTKAGKVHEREARLMGHRVSFTGITLGNPLVLTYVDDEYKTLSTSPVEAYSTNARGKLDDHVVVQTRNSVYVFRAEVADNPEN